MSTWKLNDTGEPDTRVKKGVNVAMDADNPPAGALDVDVLEIDLDSDVDCDPYNRTGQFCVPAFDKRDE